MLWWWGRHAENLEQDGDALDKKRKEKTKTCQLPQKKKGGDEDEGETEKELKNLPPLNAVRNVSNNDWNIRCGLRCESGDSHSSDWNLAS